jgi:ribosomal protein S18 acetylase RimI-like enzyme
MTDTTVAAVPAQRERDDPLEAAVRAFSGAWAAMCGTCPEGWAREEQGVLRAVTGLPVPQFNGIWRVGTDVPLGPVLEAVDEFLAGHLPWNVQLRPGYPAALDEELAARGLVPTASVPFMVLTDPAAARAAVTAGAELRHATSFVDVASVLDLLERGFGMPPELTREQLPVGMMFLPTTRAWLASTDGVDVSTAFVYVDDRVGGVYNVATPEEHRGHGHGTTATAQAVVHAFAAGADCVYLQSSPMGRSVYEKLGFATRESWQQWMPAKYVTQ